MSRVTPPVLASGPPDAIEPPVLVDADDDCIIGHWRKLALVVYRRETTLAMVSRLSALVRERAKRGNPFFGGIAVVEEHSPLPPAEVRNRIAQDVLLASGWKISALVYEGSGFRAAAVRGVILGIGLLAKPPFPHRSFATVGSAAEWIADRAGELGANNLSATGICSAMEHLREPSALRLSAVRTVHPRPSGFGS